MATHPAPAPRAQTLKQAKAAYKSRNKTTLTEREKKQIARSVELDRRAWRAQETEKRRAEAKAKREEKERKEREGGVGMTSQRRCDRFGFVGSQMHLGAFFGDGRSVGGRGQSVGARTSPDASEDEFDGDLDDESILEAAEQHDRVDRAATEPNSDEQKPFATPLKGTQSASTAAADLELLWDDMDTSTQIARDLESPKRNENNRATLNTSFGSEDFDLSVEDIEAAQAHEHAQAKFERDKKLMPPPALPPRKVASSSPSAVFVSRPGASGLARRLQSTSLANPTRHIQPTTSTGTRDKCSFALYPGFTLAELESFVEDDLQLTQVDPV